MPSTTRRTPAADPGEQVCQERHAGRRQHGLGGRQRERPQPRSLAADQHHGFDVVQHSVLLGFGDGRRRSPWRARRCGRAPPRVKDARRCTTVRPGSRSIVVQLDRAGVRRASFEQRQRSWRRGVAGGRAGLLAGTSRWWSSGRPVSTEERAKQMDAHPGSACRWASRNSSSAPRGCRRGGSAGTGRMRCERAARPSSRGLPVVGSPPRPRGAAGRPGRRPARRRASGRCPSAYASARPRSSPSVLPASRFSSTRSAPASLLPASAAARASTPAAPHRGRLRSRKQDREVVDASYFPGRRSPAGTPPRRLSRSPSCGQRHAQAGRRLAHGHPPDQRASTSHSLPASCRVAVRPNQQVAATMACQRPRRPAGCPRRPWPGPALDQGGALGGQRLGGGSRLGSTIWSAA